MRIEERAAAEAGIQTSWPSRASILASELKTYTFTIYFLCHVSAITCRSGRYLCHSVEIWTQGQLRNCSGRGHRGVLSVVLNSLTDSILFHFHPALLYVHHAVLYSVDSAVNWSKCVICFVVKKKKMDVAWTENLRMLLDNKEQWNSFKIIRLSA